MITFIDFEYVINGPDASVYLSSARQVHIWRSLSAYCVHVSFGTYILPPDVAAMTYPFNSNSNPFSLWERSVMTESCTCVADERVLVPRTIYSPYAYKIHVET